LTAATAVAMLPYPVRRHAPRAAPQCADDFEAAAVAEAQVDDRESRRMRARRGDPEANLVGGRDDKPPLHRPRETLAQGRVVIDDQQCALGLGQPL
jgi:hypothetical protein